MDVARLAGFSRTTVSYVLNHRENVSIPQATRDRVHWAAAKLGYRANGVARSLVSGRTMTIGVIVPALELSTTADIVSGAETVCSRRRYRMLLAYSHNDPDTEVAEARLLLEHRVDGIICVAGHRSLVGTPQWLVEARREAVPSVIVDSDVSGIAIDCVVGDDRRGAIAAVAHLVHLGHRRIAHLSAGDGSYPARERLAGYRQALADAALPIDESCIAGSSFDPERAPEAMAAVLELDEPPTAVFTADDLIALAAIEVIHGRGLRVPEDIAVVGFNDLPPAKYVELTTVALSAEDRGKRAAEQLFRRMRDAGAPSATIAVPTHLVVRRSCGASVVSGT